MREATAEIDLRDHPHLVETATVHRNQTATGTIGFRCRSVLHLAVFHACKNHMLIRLVHLMDLVVIEVIQTSLTPGLL